MKCGPPVGKVASLHLHPVKSGDPLQAVDVFHAEMEKGIVENPRFFGRKSRDGGPSKRQVTLIAREQIQQHADTLGLTEIAPGAARSNIETTGVDLISLIGKRVQVGQAILYFYEPRTPCWKMDRVADGLQRLMSNGKQGVLAQVVQSGEIRVGDEIRECIVAS